MNIVDEIGAKPKHIEGLVDSIINKLLPKQLREDHADYHSAIALTSEFMTLTDFPYKPSVELQKKFNGKFNDAFTRWVMEDAQHEWSGYHQPIRFSLDIPSWSIVAHQLSIPLSFDERLFPIFDFEFYHWDYGNEATCHQGKDFSTLDLIHASQLYGFAQQLKTKMQDNPHDKRCVKRDSRRATKADIDKYVEEGSGRELAHLVLDHPEKDGVDMSFLTPGGTILYLRNAPSPPRRLHTYGEIQKALSGEIVKVAEGYCEVEGKDNPERLYGNATNLMCRRNRVKEFLGSDIEVPARLVAHHREFWRKFDPENLKEKIRSRVYSYNPRSLSYGLNIPENFTLAEYCFFRHIEAFVELSRRGNILYDTAEKRGLIPGVDLQKVPLDVIRAGYQEALDFEKRDKRK